MKTPMDCFGKYATAETGELIDFQFGYLTALGFTALVIFFGRFLVSESRALQKYAILAPVVSGLIFSLMISGIKGTGIMGFTLDTETMKDLRQNLSFLYVDYGFNVRMLRNADDKPHIVIAFMVCLLIMLQNILGAAFAHTIDMNPSLALQRSSASISGGVGTASAFGPIFERMGAADAATVGVTTGMLGNIMDSLIGGLVAAYLIASKGPKSDPNDKPEAQRTGEKSTPDNVRMTYVFATCLLLAAFGTPIYMSLDSTPMIEIPKFIGCLFAGAIGRNMIEALGVDTRAPKTEATEHMFPEFYPALMLMTIDITKLAPIAGQMGIILVAQTIMMVIFAIFISFNLFGEDYGATVIVAGNCG